MIYIYWNCNQKRKALYIIKFYVFFLASYIDGLSFTDPKAHTVKTAVCNLNVGFSCRHRVNQIFVFSHCVKFKTI